MQNGTNMTAVVWDFLSSDLVLRREREDRRVGQCGAANYPLAAIKHKIHHETLHRERNEVYGLVSAASSA